MNTIAKPSLTAIHLPRFHFPRLFSTRNRRRRATIDLINSSPHLLRDIGVVEGHLVGRGK